MNDVLVVLTITGALWGVFVVSVICWDLYLRPRKGTDRASDYRH